MGWIWTLIVGAVIGAIAGAITSKGNSMGCITNIIAGLVQVSVKQFLVTGDHMQLVWHLFHQF